APARSASRPRAGGRCVPGLRPPPPPRGGPPVVAAFPPPARGRSPPEARWEWQTRTWILPVSFGRLCARSGGEKAGNPNNGPMEGQRRDSPAGARDPSFLRLETDAFLLQREAEFLLRHGLAIRLLRGDDPRPDELEQGVVEGAHPLALRGLHHR